MMKMDITENFMKNIMKSQQILVRVILAYMKNVDLIHFCRTDDVFIFETEFFLA